MKTPRRATCGHDGCARWVFTGSERRRVAVGWYFGHDGSVLCPDHLPDDLAEFLSGARDVMAAGTGAHDELSNFRERGGFDRPRKHEHEFNTACSICGMDAHDA